jgi:hypothetical protein
VFIVGLDRSGTSLTRSLINSQGCFAVAPEIHFLDHWMPKYGSIDLATSFDDFWRAFVYGKHFSRLQIDAINARAAILGDGQPSWRGIYRSLLVMHAAALGRPRWGEKTPVYFRHVPRLLDWFPQAAVVFLVRDPRGVAASHRAVQTDWADLNTGHVARTWVDSVKILESLHDDPQVYGVRYEDVVTEPIATLGRLFRFLETDFDPKVIERSRSGPTIRENGSFAPNAGVSAAHVDRWKERLPRRDVSVIEYLARPLMEKYGYQPISDRSAPATFASVRLDRVYWNVDRVKRVLFDPREALFHLRRHSHSIRL